ncbi:CPBP family intramembrane glutamic endopeptidase [Silvibacterium acidisoli]|uniref:CPBP family intramembrane glutamic endopeptidase n=1 Tax=Acidobacteriaceae bacterium ZG23-2 TaxID=2883246 RepID=UPI00406CBFA1
MKSFPRLRAFGWFLAAIVYYEIAKQIAVRAASGLSSGDWLDFLNEVILLFLLLIGFGAMGYLGQRQKQPIKAMGLDARPGWKQEIALGSAIGWSGVVACVLPVALFGGLIVTFFTSWHQFLLIFLDLAILAAGALVQEVIFRGYPFQRLLEATNPVVAVLFLSAAYSASHIPDPGVTFISSVVIMIEGWLFSIAYLRTRALWVGFGINFAWNVSMAMLFGLPVSGILNFSPVIASNAIGPVWVTGADYGPEGSWLAAIVLVVMIFVLISATKDLKFRYVQPVIVPGGMPVDIDAISRRQHEQAMGPATPAPPQIVQISGLTAPVVAPPPPVSEIPSVAPEPHLPPAVEETPPQES